MSARLESGLRQPPTDVYDYVQRVASGEPDQILGRKATEDLFTSAVPPAGGTLYSESDLYAKVVTVQYPDGSHATGVFPKKDWMRYTVSGRIPEAGEVYFQVGRRTTITLEKGLSLR